MSYLQHESQAAGGRGTAEHDGRVLGIRLFIHSFVHIDATRFAALHAHNNPPRRAAHGFQESLPATHLTRSCARLASYAPLVAGAREGTLRACSSPPGACEACPSHAASPQPDQATQSQAALWQAPEPNLSRRCWHGPSGAFRRTKDGAELSLFFWLEGGSQLGWRIVRREPAPRELRGRRWS